MTFIERTLPSKVYISGDLLNTTDSQSYSFVGGDGIAGTDNYLPYYSSLSNVYSYTSVNYNLITENSYTTSYSKYRQFARTSSKIGYSLIAGDDDYPGGAANTTDLRYEFFYNGYINVENYKVSFLEIDLGSIPGFAGNNFSFDGISSSEIALPPSNMKYVDVVASSSIYASQLKSGSFFTPTSGFGYYYLSKRSLPVKIILHCRLDKIYIQMYVLLSKLELSSSTATVESVYSPHLLFIGRLEYTDITDDFNVTLYSYPSAQNGAPVGFGMIQASYPWIYNSGFLYYKRSTMNLNFR